MFVLRAEISQLRQVVTQSMCGAFHQVIAFLPRERREVGLEFDMGFKIREAQTCQPTEDVLTRLVSNLRPVLLAIFRHVPHWNNTDDRVLSLWRHGWVQPRWGMD